MSFLACRIGFMSCVKIIGSNRHDKTARELDTPQHHRMQLHRFIVAVFVTTYSIQLRQ
jgi:hypothetical protein